MAWFGSRRLCLVTSIVFATALSAKAQASEIAFDFTGTVTNATASMNTSAGFAQLPPGVVVGAPVFATLAYDTASPGGTGIPNALTYPASAFTITIAGNSWVGAFPEIFIGSTPLSGVHFLTVADGVFSASPPPPSIPFALESGQFATLSISSSAPNFLAGEQLPTAPLDLSLANTAFGNIIGNACECIGPGPGPDANEEIDFSLASMVLAAVPEPPSPVLFGAMLLLLAGFLRRDHRRGIGA